jgi:tetratricopeptide (TPR) repeat protein
MFEIARSAIFPQTFMNPPDAGSDSPLNFASVRERAAAAMSRGDYLVALQETRAALQESADQTEDWEEHGEVLLLGGLCCFETGDLDGAEAYLNRGLELTNAHSNGNPSIFLHELSLIAHRQGDLARAKSLCERAIELRINHSTVQVRSGFATYFEYDMTPLVPSVLQLSVLKQETGDVAGAILLLDLLRTHCDRTCQLESQGKVSNELGLACVAIGNNVRAVRRLIESIHLKAFLRDARGLEMTVANLKVVLLHQPELLNDPSINHLLSGLN